MNLADYIPIAEIPTVVLLISEMKPMYFQES